jgi:hypothetical protein
MEVNQGKLGYSKVIGVNQDKLWENQGKLRQLKVN